MSSIVLPQVSELEFDERKHIYKIGPEVLPSVTTVMKPLNNALYGGVDEEILNAAARRGTAIHNSIENYLKYGIEDIEPEYSGYFLAFLKWFTKEKPKPLGMECRIYHKYLRYAGTADLPCVIGGKKICIDYKTSSQVNKMLTGVQLEAYAKAFQSHGFTFDEKQILHLRNDGNYEVVRYDKFDPESWEVFNACMTVQRHIKKYS